MKKYLLICVTYHSDKELQIFLESVDRAARFVNGKMVVDIQIVDNGEQNRGYLKGALQIYNEKAIEYDFVSISNVDLELAPDFFENILTVETNGIGWIAPDIYTNKINRHENPYMLSRPTKFNFYIWNTIYRNTFIYWFYNILHKLKNCKQKAYSACNIYAGHGSFMLFTKNFVIHNPTLHFPGFMYGEEIYMAEITRKTNLSVKYVPTLCIFNIGNVSTGRINQTQKSQWSKESLHAIQKLFFE